MTLKEFQLYLCTQLNANERLRKGGCLAMAEDSLDIDAELDKQLQTIQGVALVVITPACNVIGGGTPGYIAVEIPELTVSCVEQPTLNRAKPDAITALEAAQIVAAILGSPSCQFKSIRQSSDEGTGSLAASAVFGTTLMLSA